MWQDNSCACDRTTVVMHVAGQQLSSMWQDNCCLPCDRTTVVVHVTGQQLSCMWQDNSCRACDRTTVVHVAGQQLSCMWQDNSCLPCDRTTVVVHVAGQQLSWQILRHFLTFLTKFVSFNCIVRWRINAGPYLLRFFNTFPPPWALFHFATCITH